jgi:hypothetical protein
MKPATSMRVREIYVLEKVALVSVFEREFEKLKNEKNEQNPAM